jgi:hypothetical protein
MGLRLGNQCAKRSGGDSNLNRSLQSLVLGVALVVAGAVQAQPSTLSVCGHALVRCEIVSQGALTDCRIVAEDPPDKGLGEATLKLALHWRAPSSTANGATTTGGMFERWVQWPQDPDHPCGPDPSQAAEYRSDPPGK